jgi:hypothetical protein
MALLSSYKVPLDSEVGDYINRRSSVLLAFTRFRHSSSVGGDIEPIRRKRKTLLTSVMIIPPGQVRHDIVDVQATVVVGQVGYSVVQVGYGQ